jgi:hypothetical protein
MFVALAYFLFRKESLSDVFLGTRHAEIWNKNVGYRSFRKPIPLNYMKRWYWICVLAFENWNLRTVFWKLSSDSTYFTRHTIKRLVNCPISVSTFVLIVHTYVHLLLHVCITHVLHCF